jgi:hypothetical protein
MGWRARPRRRAFLSAGAVLTLVLCWVGATASSAPADSVALAPLANVAQQLTAYGGYVVFSQQEPNGRDWGLMAWHDGRITPLRVQPRGMPFDADAGPDSSGKPVVVYSQCTQDPPGSKLELAGREYVREPDWARARGCRIYELALPLGSPRRVRGIYAPGASDSTPAIWRGDIAFARVTKGSHVSKVYLWHRSRRLLVRLGAGRGPCPSSKSPCERRNGVPPSAWVDGMSLDSSLLSYEWSTSTASFGEAPFPELRADPLRGGRQSAASQVIEDRFASGTCGYAEGRSPNAVADSVLYTMISGDCGMSGGGPEEIRSSFDSYSTATRRWRTAQGAPGLVAAVAQDHSTAYWIADVPKARSPLEEPTKCARGYVACFDGAFESAEDCAPAHGSCTLMKANSITFGARELRHPGSLGS